MRGWSFIRGLLEFIKFVKKVLGPEMDLGTIDPDAETYHQKLSCWSLCCYQPVSRLVGLKFHQNPFTLLQSVNLFYFLSSNVKNNG